MAKPKPYYVEFSGDLTIKSIPQNHSVLCKALRTRKHVVASVAHDADIDLSFIQLLEAARRTATGAAKTFTLAEPASGQLLEAVRRGGFLSDADPARRDFWSCDMGDGR